MLSAIINDISNNVNYNIYLKSFKNKISFYVKYIDNEKYYYLNEKETNDLFFKLFNYEKKYIGKFNEYDIYMDDAKNKHYFKNGYENIELFFKNNGIDALTYRLFNNNNHNEIKKIYIENKKQNLKLFLTCSLLFLQAFYLDGYINDKLHISNDITLAEYISSDIISTYNYIDKLELNEIIEKINKSTGLTIEEKEYLINEGFFNDILNTIDRKRNEELREKLNNVTKEFFKEEDLINKKNSGGYYNPLKPNIIHVRDKENNTKRTITHEFIHLLQDNNQYCFIREAVAEIAKEEYYGVKIDAYLEEVKYVKVLMEIIGPKPIFECCFKGDTRSFENSIKSRLNENDAYELLNLFTTKPLHCKNIEEVYQRIENLITKMANYDIYEDAITSTILKNYNINRGYLNQDYIDECSNEDSFVYETLKVEDAVNKRFIQIECSAVKIDKLTLDEFLLTNGDPRNINYSSLPNFFYKDKHVINTETQEKYTLKDAIDKGYIYDVDFFKQKIIKKLSLEETIKYEKMKDYYGHIRVIDADPANVNRVEIPYFKGDIPLVKMLIKKKIEPINNKFPEQFEQKVRYNFKI